MCTRWGAGDVDARKDGKTLLVELRDELPIHVSRAGSSFRRAGRSFRLAGRSFRLTRRSFPLARRSFRLVLPQRRRL